MRTGLHPYSLSQPPPLLPKLMDKLAIELALVKSIGTKIFTAGKTTGPRPEGLGLASAVECPAGARSHPTGRRDGRVQGGPVSVKVKYFVHSRDEGASISAAGCRVPD